MNTSHLLVEIEATLTHVLQNISLASARLLDEQLKPDCELKTLAAHTRAVSAQAAALKTLTVLLEQITDPQKALPAMSPVTERADDSSLPPPEDAGNGAQPAAQTEIIKNISLSPPGALTLAALARPPFSPPPVLDNRLASPPPPAAPRTPAFTPARRS